jgi:hypothetical protein
MSSARFGAADRITVEETAEEAAATAAATTRAALACDPPFRPPRPVTDMVSTPPASRSASGYGRPFLLPRDRFDAEYVDPEAYEDDEDNLRPLRRK